MQKVTQATLDSIVSFLQVEIKRRGFKKVVLGLSGGIDSSVVATLCNRAFKSKDIVKVLIMPSTRSSKASIEDSIVLCEKFNICYEILPIREFDSVFCKLYPHCTNIEYGNFCARMRMATLYHVSQAEQRLVIGTSNKSEIMLGYGTLFGDLASAINPIGNLYKTQIYQLAHILDIPRILIDKAPSADLYEGQSDEKDLGYSYADIDIFLESYLQCDKNIEKLSNYPIDMVENLCNRIDRNTFKQELPKIFMDLKF